MTPSRWRSIIFSDTGILILLALARILIQTFTNGQYGFHRDELAMIEDARHLAWGFVAYPPFTPAVGRLALELFGPSMIGLRFFSVLSQAVVMVLVGLMAREMGAKRGTQILVALVAGFSTASLTIAIFFMYVAFDYLWWVVIAYLVIRLLKSDNPRWWLAIGAAIGMGAMTKYTIAFFLAGLVLGVLVTRVRKHLLSPWLWGGVALAVLICLPNLIWQAQHDFISLTFLSSIHERDVQWGRADEFFIDQIKFNLNPLALVLVIAGLYHYFFSAQGRPYRMLGWMFVVPLALFIILQGRGYYMTPAYPMLIAAGGVWLEGALAKLSPPRARVWRSLSWGLTGVMGVSFALLIFPIWPVNSPMWEITSDINGELKEEIGWTEMTEAVVQVYNAIPAEQRATTGIVAGNYGEAGAINLYGPQYGLPNAMSGVNSFWYKGYGTPPPQTVILVGFDIQTANQHFKACKIAAHNGNPYGVVNEESKWHPIIYLCDSPRQGWEKFWATFQYFG